ncbi:MFS transporter, DHA1 family, bicyclomycin/chloramphenicol resistance protein [Enhydrobacter aerosaccus]|uniref:Bcr/CflA family efflux transporter n=1 Tax=Enhydrobacter aerosaccus TaxID=225324 RepID=A0A1T4TG70_9HYPH|nr:multidrug effflux MFS transporter [Enhydrobacter aerosaccus]SKA39427.1 MFS transporter, DHA1 family, bicyclomycin/chloramphenicol resistance protein [Enhydrobacter aerosaccus]
MSTQSLSVSAPSSVRYAIVLGLIVAVGPFAIDMYLPALPALARDLGADTGSAQASLMAYLLAVGIGQLLSGPLSDMYGRKAPLYAGLSIFIIGSAGCAFSPTIGMLIACRVLQGLGACFSMVIPRAVVRDLHSGPEAARLMSMLMVVFSVSPILAPLGGGVVTEAFGWRAVFGVVGVLAFACMAMVKTLLPETRPAVARSQSTIGSALASYAALLRDPHFLGIALIASCALSGFFIYIANSPFVIAAHYGLPPRLYAILFSLNGVTFVAFSQLNGRLAKRFTLRRVVRAAVMLNCATILALLALVVSGIDALPVLVIGLALTFGFAGIIVPSSMVLAMEAHPVRAGAASAFVGTMNFAGGALGSALVAPFANGTPMPMVTGIAACSLLAVPVALVTLRRRKSLP